MIEEFDLNTVPLEGTNLIEAAAGTGKTYNIAGLYIRLLLEKNLAVDQILVVTFTVAATEELKNRIRGKITVTIDALKTGRSDDVTLDKLIQKVEDRKAAITTLETALRQFDEAAIFTIHGFCRRMLHDYAFESRNLFSAEFSKDQVPLLRQTVNDFWRKHIAATSQLFIAFLNGKEKDKLDSPEKLLGILSNHHSKPYMKIIPQLKPPRFIDFEEAFKSAFDNLKNAWPEAKEEVGNLLLNYDGLNRNKYRQSSVEAGIVEMDNLLTGSGYSPVLFNGFEKFTSGYINKSMKKNAAPLSHKFFDLCQKLYDKQTQLVQTYEQYILAIKYRLFEFVNDELRKSKKALNVQHFDDLLSELANALHSSIGKYLAGAIRGRFRAALIDEFQDTDPVQYDIFKTIYTGDEGILFLIGDPKQAIYSFRGADIFAYIDSISQVKHRYTLSTNWRSQPELISAVNRLFRDARKPFIYDEIPFIKAVAPKRKEQEILEIDGVSQPPFQFWFYDTRKVGNQNIYKGFINKEAAREIIAQSVTAEISKLLTLANQNKITIGRDHLQASDIAVLVRTNDEAAIVKDNFSRYNIPSVLYSDKSVLKSDEAHQLQRVLAAIANFGDNRLISAALTTDISGVTGEDIYLLSQDDSKWESRLGGFRDYYREWKDRGFISMFRTFLAKENVRSRLLSLPNGERRLTNILHLAELLHRQSLEIKLNMPGLVKWLSMQIESPDSVQDEHQLRLESDDNAVRIITIHKSKGLQYPIVFCPFSWAESRINRNSDFLFHDPKKDYLPTLDLGSEGKESNKCIAELEQLAENLRLLYVAVTRARNKCYLAWGLFNRAGSSALSYLLHQPLINELSNILDDIEANFAGLSDDLVFETLDNISKDSNQTIKLKVKPSASPIEYAPRTGVPDGLKNRVFKGSIDREWRISSFTNLASAKKWHSDIPDYDMSSAEDSETRSKPAGVLETKEPSGIFAFPKGARAGIFCHDLFENLDFTDTSEDYLKKLIEMKLNGHGLDKSWLDTILIMVKNVLSKKLPTEKGELSLAQIAYQDRLNELEFHFPLKRITRDKLQKTLSGHRLFDEKNREFSTWKKLDFNPVRGFMKGYIDLIFCHDGRFYLLDWKSNHLGYTYSDYSNVTLTNSMIENQYILQYHIYVIALHKYLSRRLRDYDYNRDFGGVFYLFLRGIDNKPDNENGIYFDKPPAFLIDELCELLIDRDGDL